MMGPDWIAVDWGTSRLRMWAVSKSGEVLSALECDRGMSQLRPCDYESVLMERLSPWLSGSGPAVQVIACGMVGAKQGWVEAAYLAAPCAPLGELVPAPVASGQIEVWICPGIRQAQPADVMRGEEVQIAGLLAGRAGFGGLVCLPGTHSKWVDVGGGEVRSFCTFLTGELFAVLAEHSILRHSLRGDGWDRGAFLEAVGQGLAEPEKLTSHLFSIRAESLLNDRAGDVSRSRLSGLLIGAELAAARPLWGRGGELVLVGSGWLTDLYAQALGAQGRPVKVYPGDELVLAGLHAAYLNLNSP